MKTQIWTRVDEKIKNRIDYRLLDLRPKVGRSISMAELVEKLLEMYDKGDITIDFK